MHWKTKGIIQRALGILPGGTQCNHLLQRTLGQQRNDSFIDRTFEQDITVIFERMVRLGLDPASSRVLEIGTGWLPVFPLSLALAGFKNIHTVDLYPHLRPAAVRRTLNALQAKLDHPCFQVFATREQIHARYEFLSRSENILEAAGISYQAPCNASSTGWAGGSLDLIASNNVFEHVPISSLLDLFVEAKRLLRPGGHVLHCINCGDHYAYSDPSITQLNYLSYSEADWASWNNPIQYQNRLRPIDFLEMAEDKRLQIVSAEYTASPANLRQLEGMVIAPEFRHYALDQLAATSLTLIASA